MTAEGFWAALSRAADALEPALARAFHRAIDRLRQQVRAATIEELVDAGRYTEAADLVVSEVAWAQANPPFRDALRQSFLRGARVTVRTARPSRTPTAEIVRVQYDAIHPVALKALRTYETTVLSGIREDLRAGVLAHIQQGVEAGEGPRTIAVGIRDAVGLTATMESHVRNFEAELRAGDRSVLRRVLRDQRYDPTIRKVLAGDGAFTEAQIRTYVAAYRQRYIAWHAEMIARTVAVQAGKAAQHAVWEQAIANGQILAHELTKTWIANTRDGRTRPGHLAMHRRTVRFDRPWDVPIDGLVMIPGEHTYNCRCIAWIRPKFGVVMRPARPLPIAA